MGAFSVGITLYDKGNAQKSINESGKFVHKSASEVFTENLLHIDNLLESNKVLYHK
jgi:hypothetical protein